MWCSVLQRVQKVQCLVCCSVLQRVAVCSAGAAPRVTPDCSVSQCVAVRCSVLQCVAMCCSAWAEVVHIWERKTAIVRQGQRDRATERQSTAEGLHTIYYSCASTLCDKLLHSDTLQHATPHSTSQIRGRGHAYEFTYCTTLQHIVTHRLHMCLHILLHTATHSTPQMRVGGYSNASRPCLCNFFNIVSSQRQLAPKFTS